MSKEQPTTTSSGAVARDRTPATCVIGENTHHNTTTTQTHHTFAGIVIWLYKARVTSKNIQYEVSQGLHQFLSYRNVINKKHYLNMSFLLLHWFTYTNYVCLYRECVKRWAISECMSNDVTCYERMSKEQLTTTSLGAVSEDQTRVTRVIGRNTYHFYKNYHLIT
jgi:hypothetical protein